MVVLASVFCLDDVLGLVVVLVSGFGLVSDDLIDKNVHLPFTKLPLDLTL